MATPSSRAPPTGNPPAQPASRPRDWSSLRSGEPGSAFRGLSRGRGGPRGSPRGRGGGRLPSTRGGKAPADPAEARAPEANATRPKPEPQVNGKAASQAGPAKAAVEKPPASPARPRAASRRTSRSVPALVVAPASPTPDSASNTPTTPSRPSNRRRRSHQQGKGPSVNTPKLNATQALRPEKAAPSSTSSTAPVKDIPPHLAAAHQAEIRHDIDALVERVRAVAMAENRPTTPGSHIDWAGDDDDSLPDLDDWGVTTTNTSNGDKNEEISPILADTLRPLPEPQAEADGEEAQSAEADDAAYSEETDEPVLLPSSPPTSSGEDLVSSAAETNDETLETPAAAPSKPALHPSLPPKPVAAVESLQNRSSNSVSAKASLPAKPASIPVDEEPLTSKTEGLSQSIHATPSAEQPQKEKEQPSQPAPVQHGLSASIHAPKGIPESHSTPTLLPSHPSPAKSHAFSPTHNRSQTEGRPALQQPHTAPPHMASHTFSRSGASSPLGAHVYTHHGRNHSTPPAGAAAHRSPQNTRPVITGEAISRLARTIGGLGPMSKAPAISVAKD
ncbi:hypothetical protein BV22DRAFT_1079146 [Leucogyrophana mollusca]|uniref:Uncharacterized protein n=1 Tax=Leucogyrophana mollusca TaxID=85980 RepID=A0ACB8BX75_9AGAM|nr:hypothetical protein BV22DRAFT_1079146 [Leucogyrophana mollusca]